MKTKLAYGKTGLEVCFPDDYDVTVIEPRFVPGIRTPELQLLRALRGPIEMPPLHEWVGPNDRIGIVFSDITRPAPNRQILPQVLSELSHVPQTNITLFNALGTHRPNTRDELCTMLWPEVLSNFRIVQNDAFDQSTQVFLGKSSRGHEIWINRELADCTALVLTGFIEPHFFAGFSGGGKAIMPGMAGQTTVLGNHDAGMIADQHAIWGITRGNPIWEEINEVAHKLPRTFLVNVALNKHKQITGVFAGQLDAAHAAGCAFVKERAMVALSHPFEIVITTNSGYPLDLNLYQAVKGMSTAAQVVLPGGSIIIASECWDGIPEHGLYRELVQSAKTPSALLDMIWAPGFLKQDQWEAQVQAQIQIKADVYVRSDGLSDDQIRSMMLKPSAKIEDTVRELVEKANKKSRVCILPEGPQTIPYLSQEN